MKGSKSKVTTIIIILVTLILAGVAIFTAIRLYQLRQTSVSPIAPSSQPKAQETACTLDAKICPDGTSVGRVPPNCDFAPCPASCSLSFTLAVATASPSPTTITCADGFNDSFEGTTLDTTRWKKQGNGTVSQNGSLNIGIIGTSGSQQSVNVYTPVSSTYITGDFQVEVDLTSLSGNDKGWGGLEVFSKNSGTYVYIAKAIDSDGTFTLESNLYKNNAKDATSGSTSLSASGNLSFRIVRQGSTIQTYYKSGSSYTLFKNFTDGFTDVVYFDIYSSSSGSSYPDVSSSFDNFSLGCIPSSSSTPTPTPTLAPGATPNACGGTCGSNFNCASNLVCYQGFCRNPECTSSTSCVCGGTTTSTSTPAPSLPQSGTDWPTIAGFGVGIFVIIGSLLLAL